jgi:cellulose biosynthesis protein BcsQ
MADRTELLTAPAAAGTDPPAPRTHADLAELQARSLAVQDWIRRQTFSPEARKRVRPFSLWETAELVLRIDQAALRARLAADPTLPQGESAPGGQRWFTLAEIDRLRARLGLAPPRPAGRRAVRTAIANFKGGAGKSTTALHFAHAAALEGYRVLAVDCDPQATLSRAMGLVEVAEERTVWGIMVRDLVRDTEARAAAPAGAESGTRLAPRRLPAALTGLGLEALGPAAFIEPTAWPGIDIIPSCANAGFVEFASAQYRHLAPDWPFFACLARFLDALEPDAYDLVLFDCPPAIGYQALNAVCAADVLYIPSGPGYWEYDSTTSFLGQLAEALEDLEAGFGAAAPPGMALPKEFLELRFLMTRYEPTNALHAAMLDAFRQVFGEHVAEHAVEHTRAVEQSGRFLASVYEMDPRDMTRETWRRARASFDRAYGEFAGTVRRAWERLPEAPGGEGAR